MKKARLLWIAVVGAMLVTSGCVTRSTPNIVQVVVEHIEPKLGPSFSRPEAITGISSGIAEIRSAVATQRIPLIKGHAVSVTFCFDERFSALEEVRLKVSYPAMRPPGAAEYSRPVDRMEPLYYYEGKRIVDFVYVFEEDWEMVPGKWHFEIWDGPKKLSVADAETYWPRPDEGRVGKSRVPSAVQSTGAVRTQSVSVPPPL